MCVWVGVGGWVLFLPPPRGLWGKSCGHFAALPTRAVVPHVCLLFAACGLVGQPLTLPTAPPPPPPPPHQANRYRKRGLDGINFTAKFLNQAGALVNIYTDGSVLITHGGVEMGQGLHLKVMQVAAHELNVPLSYCHINETATDKVPNSSPTAASASSDLYGGAVRDACRQLRKVRDVACVLSCRPCFFWLLGARVPRVHVFVCV